MVEAKKRIGLREKYSHTMRFGDKNYVWYSNTHIESGYQLRAKVISDIVSLFALAGTAFVLSGTQEAYWVPVAAIGAASTLVLKGAAQIISSRQEKTGK